MSTENNLDTVNEKSDAPDESALLKAAYHNKVDDVKRLIARGDVNLEYEGCVSFPDEKPVEGATALWTASTSGFLEIVRLLLDAGALINHSTSSKSSPLRGACFDGHIGVVRCLLERGADVDLANKKNETPLATACSRGHLEVTDVLLRAGAAVDVRGQNGDTALHCAAEAGFQGIVQLLIEAGADHGQNARGWSPLIKAAAVGRVGVVSVILKSAENHYCTDERASAVELLGATSLFLHNNKEMAMDLWRRALIDRETLACPKNNLTDKMKMYDEFTEAVKLADLENMMLNEDYLHTNAVLVVERILGGKHFYSPYFVRCYGDYCMTLSKFDRAQLCWLRALEMDLLVKPDNVTSFLNSSFVSTLSENMLINIKGLEEIEGESGNRVDVLPFFTWCLASLRAVMEVEETLSEVMASAIAPLLVATLQILGWWASRLPELKLPVKTLATLSPEQQQLLRSANELVRLKLCPWKLGGLLHLCSSRQWQAFPVKCQYSVHHVPSFQLVQVLIAAGEPLDTRDVHGNSPLHHAAMSLHGCSTIGDASRSSARIVECLLRSGAHQDAYNCDGVSARSLLLPLLPVVSKSVVEAVTGVLPLRCLAARAVALSGVEFDREAALPTPLIAFTCKRRNHPRPDLSSQPDVEIIGPESI